MMVNIAKHQARYEEFYDYRHAQRIKQPDAPLGILLIDISKIIHSEEDSHEIADADVLEQIAETLAIVVACRGGVHVLNVAIDDNCHYNGYNHEDNRGDRILYRIAKQINCTHTFIVLMMLFIDSVYVFIEFRYAKVGTIFHSTKQIR
jgi:hypothetical protein